MILNTHYSYIYAWDGTDEGPWNGGLDGDDGNGHWKRPRIYESIKRKGIVSLSGSICFA